jgi:hypothetical protein
MSFLEPQDRGFWLLKITYMKGNSKKEFLMVMGDIGLKQFNLLGNSLKVFHMEKGFSGRQKECSWDNSLLILRKGI